VKKLLKRWALSGKRGSGICARLVMLSPEENAQLWLTRGIYSMGEDVGIVPGTTILDPKTVRIGNNVLLANCTLIGHDGAVHILNKTYGAKLDRVGKIDIKDNVFIGHQAIIMPGVTIGPKAIVAAGAIVTRDVEPNSVVAGVPARKISSMDELYEKMKEETQRLPWVNLIEQRATAFDPLLEPELTRQRIKHFFG